MNFCFITTGSFSEHATLKRAFGMSKYFVKNGFGSTILLCDTDENHTLADSCETKGINCIFFRKSNSLLELLWKYQFLKNNHFDHVIINALCWRNSVFLLSGQQCIIEHCELESRNYNVNALKRAKSAIIEALSFRLAKTHMCASRFLYYYVKQNLLKKNREHFVLWSPYAVDVDIGKSSYKHNNNNNNARRKLILHIGTVVKNYGSHFMIEGLKALSKKRDDWVGVFIGTGPDLESAIKYTQELGLGQKLQFKGFVSESELETYLADATVCLSHLNDTFQDWARCPSKIYYYIATGKKIVTPKIGENAEALRSSGFYYNHNSVNSFCNAISSALDYDKHDRHESNTHSYEATWQYRTNEFLKDIENIIK